MCHVPERENRCHPFKVALLIAIFIYSRAKMATRGIETSENEGETWESAQNFNTRH